MGDAYTPANFVLENLDRGVLFAAIGGVVSNGLEAFLPGIVLTMVAAMMYGLARNRIANIDEFECMESSATLPGVDVQQFTLCCQWLASRQLRDGLLGDLVDPAIGNTPEAARHYLRKTLWRAIWIRVKEKILTLLWFDRSL